MKVFLSQDNVGANLSLFGVEVESVVSRQWLYYKEGNRQTTGYNLLVIDQHDESLRHYIEQLGNDQDDYADHLKLSI